MICPHCAAGADLVTEPAPQIAATRSLAVDLHAQCPGCDCQHHVADLETIRARRHAMPRGGLARIVRILNT